MEINNDDGICTLYNFSVLLPNRFRMCLPKPLSIRAKVFLCVIKIDLNNKLCSLHLQEPFSFILIVQPFLQHPKLHQPEAK